MYNVFSFSKRHKITEGNINFYTNPFIHPERKMNEHDFIYMLQGEWKFGQNEETFELKKDYLLILSANHYHFGISPCLPNTKTMYFHVSSEDGDFSCNEPSLLHENEICIESLLDVSKNTNIKKYFSEIINCKLSGKQRKADIYFDLLLSELSENNISDSSLAQKIKNIIHNNPEKFLSNSELANITNVSVKTAENKFKAMFGMTIHQYILKFKIDEAISYFKIFPEMSMKEISYNLGFYDEYHFSKQFKKITGLAPTEYKIYKV